MEMWIEGEDATEQKYTLAYIKTLHYTLLLASLMSFNLFRCIHKFCLHGKTKVVLHFLFTSGETTT